MKGADIKKAKLSTTRPHTEICRKRLMEKLMQIEKGRRMIDREDERIAMRVQEEVEQNEESEHAHAAAATAGEDVANMALNAINQVEVKGETGIDIAEFYSPERVTAAARLIGLRTGLAMDLTNGWDFNLPSHREAARRYVKEVEPWLIIGSPECSMFSTLQNWDKKHRERGNEHGRPSNI